MTVRVLVVDDSGFFRRRIREMLDADPRLEVVGEAANGREAIRQTSLLKPDVITMDIEMPVMDGITAVRRIMAARPTPILIFSSLSHEGAQATLDALEAGAVDYITKNFAEISRNRDEVARQLRSRVWSIGVRGLRQRSSTGAVEIQEHPAAAVAGRAATPRPVPAPKPPPNRPSTRGGAPRLVAIGASTGGPVALQQVLTALPASFPLPILLIQHMPGSFTSAFATRLDHACRIAVSEAREGELLEPGHAYLAPGGLQLVVRAAGGGLRVHLQESEPGQNYHPSVDVTFRSLVDAVGGRVLAMILTGMGSDGCEGARLLRQAGATIWAQDEETSVIYGMPQAVAQAGVAEAILPLQEIGPRLAALV